MRNLLALFAAALLIFLGLGWYLGWYKFQTTTSADGHRQINIDLDTNKIKQDVNKGKDKLRDMLTTDKNQSQNPNQPPAPQPTSVTPGTTTSYRQNDGNFYYPGDPYLPPVPPPPSGNVTLPIPQ